MRKYGKKRSRNRLGIFSIAIVVLLMGTVLTTKMVYLHNRNVEMNEQKAELQGLLEDETLRKDDLEKERIYVQTKKYIEEKAYGLGYLYPDEIIFKPTEK
ncbi:FtsB family cell division protein [Parasporobacterium paucivorans]|uniref:Septum formation initiator n=1 Tax=Parasporobacterium paucivorans DSM 15970 TaxID=1122934 RepID=A0A1M6CTJ3_9FIRM|nr:septum formation initiator family protein [Parasporobacterium paucivorans]SHI64296.1 Septum formation initiator [Parasporobacterium paucivorans DSM 15970]